MTAQAQTVAAVAQRGYLNGFTDDELFTRQLAKLAEELAELAAHVEVDDPVLEDFLGKLVMLGKPARRIFDRPAAFVGACVMDTPAAISELTDCAVVLAVAAHALDVPDLMYAASVKARQDVTRGVRANGNSRQS